MSPKALITEAAHSEAVMTLKTPPRDAQETLNQPSSIAAMIAVMIMGPMFFLLMPLYVGALIDYLHFSNQQIGQITSLELLASALASLSAFFWIRKVNWRHVAGLAAMTLLCANITAALVGDNFSLLTTIRMVAGFSAGSLLAVGIAALGDTERLDRNFAIAIAGQLGLSGALMLVMPEGIGIWGATTVFTVLSASALCALMAVPWLPIHGKKHDTHIDTHHQNAWLPIWGLLGSTAFFVAQTVVWAFVERIGMAANHSPAYIGTVLGVSTMSAMFAALSAGYLAERFNRLGIMALAALGEVICLAGITPDASAEIYFAAVFFYSLCWNLWVPIQMSTIAAVDSSGRFTVLIGSFQALGIAAGPAMVASLLTEGSYLPVNIIGAIFALVTVVLFYPIARKRVNEIHQD